MAKARGRKKTRGTRRELDTAIPKVIAKAWASEAFKQRLKADATKVLREEGVEVPRGIRVVANFDEVGLRNIVVPMKPRGLGAAETAAVARIWCSQFWCSLPW